MARTGGTSVLARALAVLSAFDESHDRLTLSDIARRAGLPLSTAHRVVAELRAWQGLERAPDGAYVIGRRLWELGVLAPVQRGLREVALPSMQDLFVATKENVTLAVLSGTKALYVERIHGKDSVALETRVGRPLPLHATGVGKVLLAFAPEEVVEACLADLAPVTRYTVLDRRAMARELAAVRRNGYARSLEEMRMGAVAVAVPITDPQGEVVAALGLVTRTIRKDLVRFVPTLRVAAATITRTLYQQPGG